MGLVGTVAALTAIAAYFPTHRRGGNPKYARNGLLILPHFLEGVDLISLSFGQLVIRSHKRLRLELRVIWPWENIPGRLGYHTSSAIALTS
jgi:hypothetical protein